jgi:ankyrin repeat protein
MTRRLLSAGADANARLLRGESVLMQAARTGSPEVVAMLLDAGADVNASGPIQDLVGPCPLPDVYALQPAIPNVRFGLTAEELERIDGMQCGLQAGHQTALMWAASNRHAEVVRLLVDHGADIHARSDVWAQVQAAQRPHGIFDHQRSFLGGGMTALLHAARVGDLASARILVDAGADPNDKDARGVTALSLAAWAVGVRTLREQGLSDDALELVAFLLEQGADPSAPTGEFDALHVAIMDQHEEMVSLLLEHGADVNAPLRGWTPTSRGPIRGYRNFPYPLVGASPLWLAARYGTPAIMRRLEDHGADPSFVFESRSYGGGSGGIDSNFNTEHLTILMAALGQGGGRATGWVGSERDGERSLTNRQRGERADVLERVRLAVEWGVDVNAVNEATSTCNVPWADTYRPGERQPCEEPDEVSTSKAIDMARDYPEVVEFLMANGSTPPSPSEGRRGRFGEDR